MQVVTVYGLMHSSPFYEDITCCCIGHLLITIMLSIVAEPGVQINATMGERRLVLIAIGKSSFFLLLFCTHTV